MFHQAPILDPHENIKCFVGETSVVLYHNLWDARLAAGAAGRRGMLATPRHLIPPLVYPVV